MGNALLYYLIVINVVTFLVYGMEGQARQLAHIGSYFAHASSHRWQYRCTIRNESLASQDEAQEVQVRTSADSVDTNSTSFSDIITRNNLELCR